MVDVRGETLEEESNTNQSSHVRASPASQLPLLSCLLFTDPMARPFLDEALLEPAWLSPWARSVPGSAVAPRLCSLDAGKVGCIIYSTLLELITRFQPRSGPSSPLVFDKGFSAISTFLSLPHMQ